MSTLVPILAAVGRRGLLPRSMAGAFEAASGFGQVLTTTTTIDAAVDREELIVPYGPRSEILGLAGFPLALDGEDHARARGRVAAALAAAAAAQQQAHAAAATRASAIVAGADGTLDVVADLIDPVLATWIERWHGLTGLGPDLLLASRFVQHAVFLNPKEPRRAPDHRAVVAAQRTVATARERIEAGLAGAPPGSLAWALLKPRPQVPPLSPAEVASHLVGLTVGPLALTSQSIAEVVDAVLDDHQLDDVAGPEAGEALFSETLLDVPPLPGVPRECTEAFTVPVGCPTATPRRTGTVPVGPVLLATAAAAHRSEAPDAVDLVFGVGAHRCMGRGEATALAGTVLHALGRRRPRRIPGRSGVLRPQSPPPGVTSWPFPGHLRVALVG